MTWLTWRRTPCLEQIQWSQSNYRHKRNVWGTYFLNTVFWKSFLTWLTSRDTSHILSQLKLVRTSLGINRNKTESFCGSYNSKNSTFTLFKLPMSKTSWCSSHFFKKEICSFTMLFTLNYVKRLLVSNLVYGLRNV